MNIRDLDFKTNLGESHQILGGLGATDNASQMIRERFLSLNGQVVGNLNASYNAIATGTNEANVSFFSDYSGEGVNQVNIGYGTSTTAFATTPGT